MHSNRQTRPPGPKYRTAAFCIGWALAVGSCVGTGDSSAGSSTPASSPATSTTATEPSPATSTTAAEPTLATAPDSERVDLAVPSFTNPTTITNPLFPVSEVTQVIQLGTVDGLPFRAEVTLLPGTKIIEWNGHQVETLVSQYVAYLDGRIHEVALDWYAQADDGAVWYFGEDVFNYEDGIVADTNGTWIAGKDGPAGMIMPADPQVGDVYRPENIPGLVFEEVTVKAIGETVDGPQGPLKGAVVMEELHMDGQLEDKTFAPGYGEFFTGVGGDLEAVAIAVPTDALPAPLPAELDTLSTGAAAILKAAESGDWNGAGATLATMTTAWETHRAHGIPPMLEAQMNDALDSLTGAVGAASATDSSQSAIDVAHASLDLQLRYRPRTEIDLARFELWTRQLLVDAAAGDQGAVLGDVTTLEWIWDRFSHTLDRSAVSDIERQLGGLRGAADGADLAALLDAAARFQDILATG